jgi:hypothetical protein
LEVGEGGVVGEIGEGLVEGGQVQQCLFAAVEVEVSFGLQLREMVEDVEF